MGDKKLYSVYIDRVGKRFYTYANHVNHARAVLYNKVKKLYPNTNFFIKIDDIVKGKE